MMMEKTNMNYMHISCVNCLTRLSRTISRIYKSAGKISAEKIKKVTNFYELWNVLEQNGYVSEGKYDILIEYLEKMKINICVIKIKEYIRKIEEYRARKLQRNLRENTDGLSESRTRQMVNNMVASAMQQFDERIKVLEMGDDGSSGKLEDRISAQITKVVSTILDGRINAKMEEVVNTKLDDRIDAKIEEVLNAKKVSAKERPWIPNASAKDEDLEELKMWTS